jgi:hypothetical protein
MGVEYDSVRALAAGFGKVPAELRKELRPRLRTSGEHLRADMRRRASYSSRIPGAIGLTVRFSARGGGIRLNVNSRRAPHARVLERGNLGGRADTFRHPVFGRDVWVTQATRPFFFPALKAGRAQIKDNIRGAVVASLREVTR